MHLTDKFDLFIFDWDFTLVTSTGLVRLSRSFKSRYSPRYLEAHKRELAKMVGNVKLEKTEERRQDLYAALYSFYSLFARPSLKENSVELLKALRKRGKKTAIFSDSKDYRLHTEVESLGADKLVDFVLSAERIGYYKPNPAGIMFVSKTLGVPARRCVYLGDMVADVMTARFGKMTSCAIADGLDTKLMLKEARPDMLFDNIAALMKAL